MAPKRSSILLLILTLIGLTGGNVKGDAILSASDTDRSNNESIIKAGDGSYLTALPSGAKEPPAPLYKTANVKGPIPTSDWWSSLVWEQYSAPLFAHPLALQATQTGMRVYYPGPDITANRVGIFGEMPGDGNDLTLGHSGQPQFPDARLHDFSDWFVTASFASGENEMRVSFGHGSPFVYATYRGGNPTITFASAPKIWQGDANSPVLGLTVNRRHYALFGPTGATWNLTDRVFTCDLKGKSYFSLAILPEDSRATLALFRRYAYNHVTNTKVEWDYDEKKSAVTTRFLFTTKDYEGAETGTIYALYPHQWNHLTPRVQVSDPTPAPTYNSICGTMKLAGGSSFATRLTYNGVLPALPDAGGGDRNELRRLIEEEVRAPVAPPKDTYWEGKWLGRIAAVIPIAEQIGDKESGTKLLTLLRNRLENWFTAQDASGQSKRETVFYYNAPWGTFIGCPASYGSDTDLSDHHFHYGYFLRATAEVARHEPGWASDTRWGSLIRLLQRDIASGNHTDHLFPFLRNFDPYASHSWASGTGKFGSGNNEESSSEAMNAWTGIILLGEAIGDKTLRDLGIYLYVSELEGINTYWFDVTGTNRPKSYTPSVVTMVWGGKMVNETWFSNKSETVHGINWTPFQSGSLYLGLYPDYVRRNYNALVAEKDGEKWTEWADLIWMYRALSDPKDALRQYAARPANFVPEAGHAPASTYNWLYTLEALGQIDRTTTANTPLYAVFRKGAVKTYVVYNMAAIPRTVTFSDGFTLATSSKGFTVKTATHY